MSKMKVGVGVGAGQEWKQGDQLQMEEGNSLKVNQQGRSYLAEWVHVLLLGNSVLL